MSCFVSWWSSHLAPFVNKKKLVGVRLHKKGEPFEISVDEAAEGGEISSVRITSEQWTIVEYELIEPYLLGNTYFELSFSVLESKELVHVWGKGVGKVGMCLSEWTDVTSEW